MSSGKMHQYQVELCAELAEPVLRDFIRGNMEYAKLGSVWHDAMALPGGVPDRKQAADHWAKRNAPFVNELIEWGLADKVAYARKHFIYGPDWYVRQIRQALCEGSEKKAAVVWGVLLHSCEYLTASKSSSLILHDLSADMRWAERWLVNGHPFQDEFVYRDRKNNFNHEKNVALLSKSRGRQDGASFSDLYKEMLREHYLSFFPDELQWLIDCEDFGPVPIYDRYEALCFRELAGTLRIALAGLRDALAQRCDAQRAADVLFLIREDLWRRAMLESRGEPRRRVIEGLRYVSAAIRLGLSFELWSGEGGLDVSRYKAVAALCGEPLGDEADFQDMVRNGEHVIVVNQRNGEEEFGPFFQSLRNLLGKERVPEDAHQTPPQLCDLFRRLKALRAPRLVSTLVTGKGGRCSSEETFNLVETPPDDNLRCVFWDQSVHPRPQDFFSKDSGAGRWTIKAPDHGTLYLEKSLNLPAERQIILRLSLWVVESIAVGMVIEAAGETDRQELVRMHVTNPQPQEFAFDLTSFAGQRFILSFAWHSGYDFGYQDKDILIVQNPEIICRM